ncbi:CRISPR-associated protein cas6/cse3/case, subtype I-e [Corynebacterium pyruviciproducens ATCC BAA-1742]|uniref:CRISPR-associated protein cas6/cse3/case, subtype I-e n=1 Tax=Corynebacterium pyruviciproducens ATCC BAA-1742 TaxID=1125779 RepID=S2ZEA7_9CORY|nr:type I-E CRISPR-associated protein Cas6/Cse3/CasE [Corynebacterium pyruviciproducens]EPD68327.1 CRISPR-associated protein cas6/cse3/case, subtype I-e [Corynebacterium pyruviciproducens ATCC BAA-1742]
MTTFTRIYVNPQKRQGRKVLMNPEAMHAEVRGLFPPDISTADARVLWRLDQHDHEYQLYIVGPERPETAELAERIGWATRPAQTADYDKFLRALTKGQKWNFALTANPTISVKGDGKRGKSIPLVKLDQQIKWLQDRSAKNGFSLFSVEGSEAPDLRITRQEVLRFSKDPRSRKATVALTTARFEGSLEVTNSDALRTLLTQGIGKGRAYGLGLMTLARR